MKFHGVFVLSDILCVHSSDVPNSFLLTRPRSAQVVLVLLVPPSVFVIKFSD